jgi:hypothetical protein
MSDPIKVLSQHNICRRGEDESVQMLAPVVIGQAIDAACDELERLRMIEAAARNLVAMKGRHNTAAAYAYLVEVLA